MLSAAQGSKSSSFPAGRDGKADKMGRRASGAADINAIKSLNIHGGAAVAKDSVKDGRGAALRPSTTASIDAPGAAAVPRGSRPSISLSDKESKSTLNVNVDGDTFLTQQAGKLLESTAITNAFLDEGKDGLLGAKEHGKDLQSTLLIRRRKELKAVQMLLEKKRSEFSKRMEECREKQEELKSKQRQLRERVQKFERFLRENDAKRQRALAKALTERKLREQKEQELGNLQEQLRQEQNRAEKIKNLIRLHQPFETYLSSVILSLPADYLDSQEPQINDILQRHHTLSDTNRDLQATLQMRLDEIERETNRLNDLVKLKNDRILVYNSQLGALQKRLDKAKTESTRLETVVTETISTGKARMRMLSEIKLAINNIYSRINVKLNPITSPEMFFEKLAAIQDRILDLTQIAAKTEQFMREERERVRFRFREGAAHGGNAAGGGGGGGGRGGGGDGAGGGGSTGASRAGSRGGGGGGVTIQIVTTGGNGPRYDGGGLVSAGPGSLGVPSFSGGGSGSGSGGTLLNANGKLPRLVQSPQSMGGKLGRRQSLASVQFGT